ncbi:diguanylate cyclase [Ruminococcus sp. FC2018]|uniref:sensor domain-containing diguanylate cyclase n=1 Tax=Ruminococcus sp. FC2018 TaxID=1410617 RepID=UPI00048A8EE4|nr:diguanylate cyclase [Ruminococcus sp. FC2018]
MKQIQFDYQGKEAFVQDVRKIKQWCVQNLSSLVMFDIYSEILDKSAVDTICSVIKSEIPQAVYMGCTTNGNILQGELSKNNICIVCTIFEYPDTRAEVMQYRIDDANSAKVGQQVVEYVNSNSWIKAVEMLITIRGLSTTEICGELSKMRKDVELFGGGAFAIDIDEQQAYVFSGAGECETGSVVFRFIGGDNIHAQTWQISGWKPLGVHHDVTRSQGKVLYEIDNQPAFDVYYKYLNIENDRYFFKNSLEFPLVYKKGESIIMRAPTGSTPDGALMMTANIKEGTSVRMAYGDPETILRTVMNFGEQVSAFQPQAIKIFSCAARKFFWGKIADTETKPFHGLAPTSGFYTSGEFLRKGEDLIQHNVTLVIAALREGEAVYGRDVDFNMRGFEFTKQVSVISRLANFIEVSTAELEEANQKLEKMAVTDGLTKLFNRMKIQDDIIELVHTQEKVALIMIDIDDFKKVNDTYGHDEGDLVLISLSDLIMDVIKSTGIQAVAGRWGGEEFMVCIWGEDAENAQQTAEQLRLGFNKINFKEAGYQTISAGVAYVQENENPEKFCIRVDDALYAAKKAGKNRVITL